MGLRPFLVFDCVATWASNSGSELFDVLLGDSSLVDSCSFIWQWQDWDRIHSDFWSVCCPACRLDGFFVPSALRFQSSDFTSSENTICIPNEAFCTVVSHFEPKSERVSGIHSVHGICGDLLCQHFLTKCDKFLGRFLAMQSFEWKFLVTTFLTSGQDAYCMFHQPRQNVIRH